MTSRIKKIVQNYELFRKLVDAYHYYIPYKFLDGSAFHPLQLIIELTYSCNLNCEMCPLRLDEINNNISDNKNNVSIKEWIKIIQDFADYGGKRLQITGGEPLLVKDFHQLLHKRSLGKLNTTLLSNAALITKNVAEQIVNSGLKNFTSSLDGPKDVHDKIRGKGSYKKTINGIRMIAEAKEGSNNLHPNIHCSFTLTSTNQSHISELVDEIPNDIIKSISINRIFYTTKKKMHATKKIAGNNWVKKENWLLPRELCEFDHKTVDRELIKAESVAKNKGIKLSISPIFSQEVFEEQIKYDPPPFAKQCYHPWMTARIDPYGNVYACSISSKLGNVREKKFSDIWNDKPYQEFRKMLQKKSLLPMCSTCCGLAKPEWNILPRKKYR